MPLLLDETNQTVSRQRTPPKRRPAIRLLSRRSLFLFFFDTLAILGSFFLSFYVRGGIWDYNSFFWNLQNFIGPVTYLSIMVLLTSFYIFDLYNPYKYFKPFQTTVEIVYGVFLGGLILASVAYLDRTFLIARPIFVVSIAVSAALVFCIRMLYDALFEWRILKSRALIVGTGSLALEIANMIARTPHSGIEMVGHVQSESAPVYDDIEVPILGDVADLTLLIHQHNIQLVILGLKFNEKLSESEILYTALKYNTHVVSAVGLCEKLEGTFPYQAIGDHYLLSLMDQAKKKNYLKAKRIIDLLFSFFLLAILSPLFLVAMGLLSFQGVDRIFFIQTRIGKNGVPFRLYKFRTMSYDSAGQNKVTRIGQWLRKYRIDELPQILNVFRGDMSLIGPRPEMPYFAEECQRAIPFYNVIFALRPGLTGWAQVKFKYTTSAQDYDRKFCYNLYYLKNISPALDLVILLKTIRIILLGRGQ